MAGPYVSTVLDRARSQLGVHEDPPGSNVVLYATWAGLPQPPAPPDSRAWCAAYYCWVMDGAGALDVPLFVNCQTGVDLYKRAHRFGQEPRLGAAIFFSWNGTRADHIGIVESLRSDGAKVTLEGNTDEKGGRTGGKVMRQVRRANIVGYGYPIYAALAPPEVMLVKPTWDPPLNVVDYYDDPDAEGGWGLGPDGGVFQFGTPNFYGSMAGNPNFKGRVAADLGPRDDGKRGYMITATSKELYRLP